MLKIIQSLLYYTIKMSTPLLLCSIGGCVCPKNRHAELRAGGPRSIPELHCDPVHSAQRKPPGRLPGGGVLSCMLLKTYSLATSW